MHCDSRAAPACSRAPHCRRRRPLPPPSPPSQAPARLLPPSPVVAAKFEQQGARYWDLFYKRNSTNFFKDRHWLAREFPALLDAATVLEVRCACCGLAFDSIA